MTSLLYLKMAKCSAQGQTLIHSMSSFVSRALFSFPASLLGLMSACLNLGKSWGKGWAIYEALCEKNHTHQSH